MHRIVVLFFGLICVLFLTSCFIIKEGEQGIILRFGKILQDINGNNLIYKPGLHYKFPFIDDLKKIDIRINTCNAKNSHFFTQDKINLTIDYFIQWKIIDCGQFFLSLGNTEIFQAEKLLKDQLNNLLRLEISQLTLKDVLIDSKQKLTVSLKKNHDISSLYNKKIYSDLFKSNLIKKYYLNKNDLHQKPDNSFNNIKILGVQLVDIRIKKIKLPNEVLKTIYDKIRSKTEKIICDQRLQSLKKSERIRNEADYMSIKILSKAKKYAAMIRKESDLEIFYLFTKLFYKYYKPIY